MEDWGLETDEALLRALGDADSAAAPGTWHMPGFGPGWAAQAPSKLQEGVSGFGPGSYKDGYTGQGDSVYWGALDGSSSASTTQCFFWLYFH